MISISDIVPTEDWFSIEKFYQIKASVSAYQQLHESYTTKKAKIFADYDKEILKIDYYPILQRFRGDYNSFFRIFKSQYIKDTKLLRGFSKNGKKLSYNAATSTLNLLKEVADAKEKIDFFNGLCKKSYGVYYQGTDTNWEKLLGELSAFEQSVCSIGEVSPKLKQLLLKGELPLNGTKQFLDSYASSEINNRIDEISHILLIDADGDKGIEELIEGIRHSIRISEDFLGKYNELKGYRKSDTSYFEIIANLDIMVSYQKTVNSLEFQKEAIQKMFAFYYKGVNTDWDSLYKGSSVKWIHASVYMNKRCRYHISL